MTGLRVHTAVRWYGPEGLVLKCRCGEFTPVPGTARVQEAAHRAHRLTMGETVAVRRPTQPERLRLLQDAVERAREAYQAGDWQAVGSALYEEGL